MALSLAKANLKPAALKNLYVKATTSAGVADAAYYALPFIRAGIASIKTFEFLDSVGREYPFAGMLHIEAECTATHKTNMLKMLDALATNQIDVYGLGVSTQNYFTEGLTPAFAGLKWSFICDGSVDKHRFVKFEFSRGLQTSEFDAVLSLSSPTLGTPATSDVLYALNSLVRADIIPAGFKSVTCSAAGGGGATDNFGLIRNGKLTMELLVDSTEMYLRAQGYLVHFAYEFEMMQTANSELIQLDTIATRENDFKITLMDGTVVTLTSQAGVTFDHQNNKDSTDIAFTKFLGSGTIPMGSLDAVFV